MVENISERQVRMTTAMRPLVAKTLPIFSLTRSSLVTRTPTALFTTSVPRRQEPAWRVTPTKMTSSEAFTETMVAHKVENMFGIVGSAFMDALDIFPAAGIRCCSSPTEDDLTPSPGLSLSNTSRTQCTWRMATPGPPAR